MSTSTPKNSKLYGYLKGYEQCCYTGQNLTHVSRSTNKILTDEFRILFPESCYCKADLKRITACTDKYFIRFYDRMKNIKTPDKVKLLADKAKSDKDLLNQLVNQLVGTDNCATSLVAYMPITGKCDPIDICERCPWYIHHKFCMIYCQNDEDEAIIEHLHFNLPESKYLALALLRTANFIAVNEGIDISKFINYYSIFTNILTCSQIFELMNPSGEAREDMLQGALDMLTQEPIDYSSDQYKYYLDLLRSVFRDIRHSKLQYVSEMQTALRRSKSFLESKFDPERDYFYSMKGTAQSRYTGERHSLQSSAFEVDVFKDDPKVRIFDLYIGYESYYKDIETGDEIPVGFKTIGINNPGKFKIRIIHILDNAGQDRCNFINRRTMKVLNYLPNDCTRNQDQGRQFLKNLTLKWHLSPEEDKIGIYCTDFSNATDTVDQVFTHEVLKFVFQNDVIADFWDVISKHEKEFIHADGRSEKYVQLTGQPQGALGSFCIFSLCHHFLFLMDMKEMGLTDMRASEYYHILGDDAVYNTIIPEKELFEQYGELHDQAGITRSKLEIAHFNKCELFAAFKINFDKSESAHYYSREACLDFAKVTYRNGNLFSPIPFRLAMKYSNSFDDQLAVAIWRADRGDKSSQVLITKLLEDLDPLIREDYRIMLSCGELPFLDAFKDDSLVLTDDHRNLIRYALFATLILTGLSFTILGDAQRSNSKFDQFDQAMATVFTPAQAMRLDKISPYHKIMDLVEKNGNIIAALKEITGKQDLDDRFLSMCLASFLGDKDEDILWMIYDIASFQNTLRLASANPEFLQAEGVGKLPELPSYRDHRDQIGSISNAFLTRGITKRPGECSYLFRKVFNLMNSVKTQLNMSLEIQHSDI